MCDPTTFGQVNTPPKVAYDRTNKQVQTNNIFSHFSLKNWQAHIPGLSQINDIFCSHYQLPTYSVVVMASLLLFPILYT